MTTTLHEWLHTGDKVILKSEASRPETAKLYRITSVKRVRYAMEDEEGRPFTVNMAGVTAAPADRVWTPKTPPAPRLQPGMVVEFTGETAMRAGSGKFVCIKRGTGDGIDQYAKLNGGTTLWKVHARNVRVVEAS